jgi:UDP-N-acetyl-D-mannosaminuronic acid transferase (WecB/TagA/CpsF family)
MLWNVIPTAQVLGVDIALLTADEAVDRALAGGLVLAPSGPGLCELERDLHYREALRGADLNLTDSGLVVLAEAVRTRRRVPRTSGLGYISALLARPEVKEPGATFWIMPSRASLERNLAWLRSQGFATSESDCYVAPFYPRTGPVNDPTLATAVSELKPKHIVICIGGGTQEKLGLYLKRHLTYRASIHCLGAAIAFLSGEQASIPKWADRVMLGWLLRCLDDPRTFVPRYLKAFRLVYLLARYGSSPPPIPASAR